MKCSFVQRNDKCSSNFWEKAAFRKNLRYSTFLGHIQTALCCESSEQKGAEEEDCSLAEFITVDTTGDNLWSGGMQ